MAFSIVQFVGDGNSRTYSFPFPYISTDHIIVTVGDSEVAFAFDNTNTITLDTAAPSGDRVTIARQTPKVDVPVDFSDGSILREADLDTLAIFSTYVSQETYDRADQALGFDTATGKWDATTFVIKNVGNPVDAGDAVNKRTIDNLYPFVATVAGSIGNVNTVGASIVNVNTVAGIITNVNTVAGNNTNVSKVAAVDTKVTTVANNDVNVTTVANDIGAVNTTAASIAGVNTTAGSIGNVNTVATNVANVNTVAGISGNVTTVSGIASAVSTVSGNTANLNTVAGISGNVTTVAGIATNINTVASNAANINTVAGVSTSVTTVSSNIAAIQGVPAQASAAASSASASSVSASSSASSALASAASAVTAASYIPDNSGNSGKFLTTDGSANSWAAVDALPSQTGNNGKYLTTDGSAASWDVLDTTTALTLDNTSGASIPGTPSAGQTVIYPKDDKLLYYKNDAGQELPPGKVVQVVNFQTGAMATGTTITPWDDTIPQITEGNEYMTLAITPTNANNILIVAVEANAAGNTAQWMSASLFRDAGVNALSVMNSRLGGDIPYMFSFTHHAIAGSTSATTFKVRIGGDLAGTTTFNGSGGVAKYGGRLASSITITEITP